MNTTAAIGIMAFLFGLVLIPISVLLLFIAFLNGSKKLKKVGLYLLLSAGVIMMLSVVFCSIASSIHG